MSDRAGALLTQPPATPATPPVIAPEIAARVLEWGSTQRRDLPWRRTRDPWAVLVSEVMLQQTQVARVVDRFGVFLACFPTPSACAAAPASDVIGLWSGLGYNRRAVNLWHAAGRIVADHGGYVPAEFGALVALPGVGAYTARAVLAFAFEHDVGVVDTNVGRLLARWGGRSLTAGQAQATADSLVPAGSGWAWNQALFDFATAVCFKREPTCRICPVREHCAWHGSGPDPADATAGVSGRQSRFVGSERQVRGRIVEALRGGPMCLDELSRYGRTDDDPDLDRIVSTLVTEGLVERDGALLRLPARA